MRTPLRSPAFAAFLACLFFLAAAPRAAAQTHPFIIVRENEYAALQALSVGAGARAPWIAMRAGAISTSNNTAMNTGAGISSRAQALTKIMDSTALAYIVDPANRGKYRDRIYAHLKYWDLAQTGNVTRELSTGSWDAMVPPAAAFFATLVAMDIIHNDPGATPAQLVQRDGFNALMEISGDGVTKAPAAFFTTEYEPYHLESLMSARALWALWRDGPVNNPALDQAVAIYKQTWKDRITEDGCYVEYGGYALARAGDPSRYNKGVFHDVIIYAGIDPAWYSDPKMVKFHEWLAGYALAPNRYGWPIGDSSYAPFQSTYQSALDRASAFSPLAGDYAEWQQDGDTPSAKLFSYLVRARTAIQSTAREPGSRLFANGAAYLRQKNGGEAALAAVLTNLKTFSVPNVGHMHKATNSLGIAGFGEILLRGPGYNGYAAAATDPNNFGFDFSYVNNHAISENIALFNYAVGNYQNPSFTNDHRAKHGGYGVQGLLSDGLDYAAGDSGLLSDPNRAINNGRHVRHVVALYPQDGVNGYVCSFDELEGNASATTGQLAWHPYSDTITVNADNSADDRYEWRIRQKANKTDQLFLSIYLPTAPSSRQQYDGLFADDIQGGASTSFVGRYLFNGYALNPTTKKKNVLTMFFPRKSTQAAPAMTRLAASAAGFPDSQAAALAFAGGVTDFALESDGARERVVISPVHDPLGAAARGKAVVYRKKTSGADRDLLFYFVGKGRSFKNRPTGFTEGFVSDVDVDLHVRGAAGTVVSAGALITFYHPGFFSVVAGGATLPALQSGDGYTQVAMPAGSIAFTFASASASPSSLLGAAAATGEAVKTNPANAGNLLGNPSFENGALIAPWTFAGNGAAGVSLDAATARTGAYGVRLVTPSAGTSQYVTLKPGTPYVFSGWALESLATTNSYLSLYGAGSLQANFTATTPGWQQAAIAFTTGGGTPSIQALGWFSGGSPGNVVFDDFAIHEQMSPGASFELGARFQSERHARVTALRVWHPLGGPAAYTLNLWNVAGQRVAQVVRTAPTAAGWVEGPLVTPVEIGPGEVYTVSYGITAAEAYQVTPSGLTSPAGPAFFHTAPGSNGVYASAANTFPSASGSGANYWADVAFEFIPAPPTSLQTWRALHFSEAQLADPDAEATVWGDLADPDHDGLANLLEYALAGDPAASDAGLIKVATSTRTSSGGDPEPVLELRFFRARAELDYIVEGSFDLAQWLPVATNPGAVGAEVVVSDNEPLTNTGTRRFLRLRVTHPIPAP